jgi:uracil-DNA glycosylase
VAVSDLPAATRSAYLSRLGIEDWQQRHPLAVEGQRRVAACAITVDWMVVSDIADAEERGQGEPEREAVLLQAMLRAIDLAPVRVAIVNGVQTLTDIEQQIELLQPKVILAVGRRAAQSLLVTDTPIGKLRGQLHAFGARRIPLVVTYHPAYLLRSPSEKRKAWEDLKFARQTAGGVFQ